MTKYIARFLLFCVYVFLVWGGPYLFVQPHEEWIYVPIAIHSLAVFALGVVKIIFLAEFE